MKLQWVFSSSFGYLHQKLKKVHQQHNTHDSEGDDIGEPQHDVRLFIHNVQRKHAERVVLLDGSRGTIFVPIALSDLSRQNQFQLVVSIFIAPMTNCESYWLFDNFTKGICSTGKKKYWNH